MQVTGPLYQCVRDLGLGEACRAAIKKAVSDWFAEVRPDRFKVSEGGGSKDVFEYQVWREK